MLPVPCYSGNMASIIKWAGGKEKELPYIIQNAPESFEDYYEPFVGGGSVFMAVNANHYYINDLSSELYQLYQYIKRQDEVFFDLLTKLCLIWDKATDYFASKQDELILIYQRYRNGEYREVDIKEKLICLCDISQSQIIEILPQSFRKNKQKLIVEIGLSLYLKMLRMRKIEVSKNVLPEKDIADNLETAVKSGVYTHLRMLYNDNKMSPLIHCCLFFFVRNYAYSGMFRYNKKGDFNVPYGGIAYNKKSLLPKIDYYRSEDLVRHFSEATITGLDFESFFEANPPKNNDFVFLDPPYDSDFSTYAQNEFSQSDHKRLAHYLIHKVRSKWMMIIKSTPFILSLYSNVSNINVSSFEKKYQVSFMNRNQKMATHLIIKNY